ncbi:MAG: phosphoglycerate dehydrogenase [Pseudomonadota bacterium]
MSTVLATTSSFGRPELFELLEEAGLNIVLNPWRRKLTEDELCMLLEKNKPVGLLAGTEPITRPVLEAASGYLRIISRVGVGWDNVDREAAVQMGMKVYRTTGVLSEAVAELTIGLILSALRFISLSDRQIRNQCWEKHMGRLLAEKTVGIIGFGSIGRRVGELVDAFGARVIYHDCNAYDIPRAEAVSLAELLERADIISVHASGKEMILGPEELKKLKRPGVILVNTARGSLIDEHALSKCLQDGRIGFACLDVFQNEPYTGPLSSLENVILTPHIGSYAREARELMERKAVENLLTGIRAFESK